MNQADWHFTLFGMPAGFGWPELLWVAGVAAVVGILLVIHALRSRGAPSGWAGPRFARLVSAGSRRRRVTRAALSAVGLMLCALAIARPQLGGATETQVRRGIDVVVALDASHSMLARDVAPDRMGRAKVELETLLEQLGGDRVGLVTFASNAFVQMPLTSDYAAARMFLRAVDPKQMPQGGTDIGGALRLSKQLLDDADNGAKERAVVLVSDGEDWRGDALEAAGALREAGVRLLTVGVGSIEGEPVPDVDEAGRTTGYKRDAQGKPVVTRLNRDALAALAKEGGGSFHYEPRGVAMGAVGAQIAAMQKSDLQDVQVTTYTECYQWFAFPGLLLLVLGALLRESATDRPPLSKQRKTAAIASSATFALLFVTSTAEAASIFEKQEEATVRGAESYRQGDYDAALNAFEEAAKEHGAGAVTEFDRGAALHKLGRTDDAKQAFERAASQAEGSMKSHALYNLGNTQVAAKDEQSAIGAYRKALREDPSNDAARHNLEVLLAKKNQNESNGEQKKPPQSVGGEKEEKPEDQKQDGAEQASSGGEGEKPDGEKSAAEQASSGGDGEKPHEQEQVPSGQKPSATGQNGEKDQNPADGDGRARTAAGVGKQQEEATDGQRPGEREHHRPGGDRDGRAVNPAKEGERILDAMRTNEEGLQLWKFQAKEPRRNDENEW